MARILVIDDDPGIQNMVRLFLENAGHMPLVVGDGPAGLAAMRAEKFDLIVCDVMMPEMDGYEVVRQIRTDPALKDSLVLVFTARAQQVDYEMAVEAGADGYIAKPVTPPQLKEKVSQMLSTGRPAPAIPTAGRVIACLGLRGGVGVTTLAANVGAILTRAKRRVCLIDLSPSSGHLALHFRLRAKPNWADLPSMPEPQSVGPVLLKHEAGLGLLAAPAQPVRQSLYGPTFEKTLSALQSAFTDIVVDTAPVLDDPTLIALRAGGPILLVLTPDVASIQTTTGTLQTLVESAIAVERIKIVLNQVSPDGALPQAAVEKAINRPVDAVLPYDRAQLTALLQGAPLSLTQPASPLVQAIGQFAIRL